MFEGPSPRCEFGTRTTEQEGAQDPTVKEQKHRLRALDVLGCLVQDPCLLTYEIAGTCVNEN